MIYRGYEIELINGNWYVSLEGKRFHVWFETEEAAMNWVDAHKKANS